MTKPLFPTSPYPTRSPSGYTCSQNYRITTNVHFNNIYSLCDSSRSSLMGSSSSNSLLRNNVSTVHLSLSLPHLWLFRVIHLHLITIHSKPLSSVSSSLSMFSHSLWDHNQMFSDMVFECSIHREMSMTSTIHPWIRTQVDQWFRTFLWPRWLFVCISTCTQQVMVDHRVIFSWTLWVEC